MIVYKEIILAFLTMDHAAHLKVLRKAKLVLYAALNQIVVAHGMLEKGPFLTDFFIKTMWAFFIALYTDTPVAPLFYFRQE